MKLARKITIFLITSLFLFTTVTGCNHGTLKPSDSNTSENQKQEQENQQEQHQQDDNKDNQQEENQQQEPQQQENPEENQQQDPQQQEDPEQQNQPDNPETLHQLTDAGDFTDFWTDSEEKLGFGYTSGKLNIIAKNGNEWVSILDLETTTDFGWQYQINLFNYKNYPSGTIGSPGVKLTLEPSIIYDNGIPYVQLKHTLTNPVSSLLTNQKFGAGINLTIAGNKYPSLLITDTGIKALDQDSNMLFILDCLDGENITPVDTLWTGAYDYDYNLRDIIYTDNRQEIINAGTGTRTNTALAFSWQNISLDTGESKDFTIRLSLLKDQNNPVQAIIY